MALFILQKSDLEGESKMKLPALLLLALGLSMDAFAVSVSDGLCFRKMSRRQRWVIPLLFGVFQGIMPLMGCLAGSSFSSMIIKWDHWIACGLLSFIGIRMILSGLRDEEKRQETCFTYRTVLTQATATSIDALAVGVSFALMEVNAVFSSAIIAGVTFLCCLVGVLAGERFGSRLGCRAEILGGVVLTAIGIRILAEHLLQGG